MDADQHCVFCRVSSRDPLFLVPKLFFPDSSGFRRIIQGLAAARQHTILAQQAAKIMQFLRDGQIDPALPNAVRRDGAAVQTAVSRIDHQSCRYPLHGRSQGVTAAG